ncbi:class I SAM-dependent methyltransferase [Rhodococcoides trifolii]|uniref:class I SAM-dependent methyltransferase n=1 Tax=Rhodococcoides trifolii TaxID=908250 RepID=UPI00166C796B|nr:methyltransferase [Rhodococcus trifolii]
MADLETIFSQLRRAPDVEAVNLFAYDASDRLILAAAGDAVLGADAGSVVVIGDRYGALTLGAAGTLGATDVRVHQDALTGEIALARNASATGVVGGYRNLPLGEELVAGAEVVLLQLPRALAELTELAETVARWASPTVRLYAAGRVKHMTRSMNDVLAHSFTDVQATRAAQKSRGLIASGPIVRTDFSYPVTSRIDELDLDVVAHGAVFAGDKYDVGTRFLMSFLDTMRPDAHIIVDLGCGTGILAVEAARRRPAATVVATDRSSAAVASTLATATKAGVAVEVMRDDAMASMSDSSVDLILCNPPFHENAAVHTGGAEKLFAAAKRVLRPGGELWTVHNAHLHFRPMLGRVVGPTDTVGRNAKFTVTRSVR